MTKKILFWFRRDLRLEDNAGLFEALKTGLPVIPLFIFDTTILSKLENKSDRRVNFIFQALQEIDRKLKPLGTRLCIKQGIPSAVLQSLTDKGDVSAVYANRDYEPYARKRDEELSKLLSARNVDFHTVKDQVIFEPAEILKSDRTPYTVYTPYSKAWRKSFQESMVASFPSESLNNFSSDIPQSDVHELADTGFQPSGLVFTPPVIPLTLLPHYHTTRNIPAMEGTSGLSVHLRFGTISIRRLVQVAFETNDTWLGELIWREFFMMILFHFPYVAERSFKPAYDFIPWRNNEEEFSRWCHGQTGYPIVDAGMRELLATGRMHNRVRMITASFLTKHLLIDWRWGEAWFAKHLLDFDLSANNGNWQWAAGCGCDAAPYFRIFNPYEQTKKFDIRLQYVGKWIPELDTPNYPNPIVEHKVARERALAIYKLGLESAKNR